MGNKISQTTTKIKATMLEKFKDDKRYSKLHSEIHIDSENELTDLYARECRRNNELQNELAAIRDEFVTLHKQYGQTVMTNARLRSELSRIVNPGDVRLASLLSFEYDASDD